MTLNDHEPLKEGFWRFFFAIFGFCVYFKSELRQNDRR